MTDPDAARAEALSLLDRFRARDIDTTEFWRANLPAEEACRRALAEAFDRIGVEIFNHDDAAGARDAFWPLFLLRLEIVKAHPDDRADIRDFASAEDLLGQALLALGNLGPAEEMFGEALKYRGGLSRDDASDAHAAYLYGVALWHMARLARAKNDAAAELDWVTQARDHLAQVDAAWPGVSFIVDELAETRQRLAELSPPAPMN